MVHTSYKVLLWNKANVQNIIKFRGNGDFDECVLCCFQRISSEMKSFFTSQREMHALECWEIYVQICGKVRWSLAIYGELWYYERSFLKGMTDWFCALNLWLQCFWVSKVFRSLWWETLFNSLVQRELIISFCRISFMWTQ